jgi:aspartate/methionine/tyrosine aminotransferase
MFSSRFHWDVRPNRLTELLRHKRSAGARVLDLTESNPTHAGLEYPPEILDALADPRSLRYDPDPAGLMEARRAVSAHYKLRAYDVEPERILLTASTSEAYAYLFKLLCNPGDEVLVPRPSYPLFEFLADMENVQVRRYPLRYHGEWSIDREALRQAVTARTRAIVVVNPNNPTGSYLKRDELRFLESLRLPLISDEVFADYNLTQDPARVYSVADVTEGLAFAMSGLSKGAGLPQIKLGWIAANSRDAMERLEWIADTYLSVSTPVQYAAGALMDLGSRVQRQIRGRCSQNLRELRDTLQGSAADVLPVEGGWYATLKVPRVRTEEEWTLLLLDAHDVLVQPGFFYDFETEAFLILSLLTPPDVLSEGVRRLAAAL